MLEERDDDEHADDIDYLNYAKEIAKHMFELFWYPKVPKKKLITINSLKWLEVKDNYKKGTRPRDNSLETLYEVTANHIDLVLTCHSEFTHPPELIQQVVEEFIILVASKGTIKKEIANWGMSRSEHDEFHQQVKTKLVLSHGREELDKSASQSEVSSSATSRDITLPPPNTAATPRVGDTLSIHQRLGTPVTPPQFSLTHLIHPADTPLTTASDISFRDESSEHSQTSEEESSPRITRSQEHKTISEQLHEAIEQAKNLKP